MKIAKCLPKSTKLLPDPHCAKIKTFLTLQKECPHFGLLLSFLKNPEVKRNRQMVKIRPIRSPWLARCYLQSDTGGKSTGGCFKAHRRLARNSSKQNGPQTTIHATNGLFT
jgi:hypothetical protein